MADDDFDDLDAQIREAAKEFHDSEAGAPVEASEPSASEEAEAVEPASETDDVIEPVETVEPALPAIEPAPQSWGAATKTAWAKLPQEVRKEILKREGDIAKGFQQHAERAKASEEITRALEPIAQGLAMQGATPAQFVQRAVAIDAALQRDPVGAIQWLAKTYGFDLSSLAPKPADGEPAPEFHPVLQQRLEESERQLRATQEILQRQERERAQANLDAFMNDPECKYANESVVGSELANSVIRDMQVFLAADPSRNLKAAYKKAIRINDAASEAIAAEAAAKRAAEAKRRPAQVRASAQPARADVPADLESQIRQAADELRAAGRI